MKLKLQNSEVQRAGVTAAYWSKGTTEITAEITFEKLNFLFAIPSKGGGKTQVSLDIGIEDIVRILDKLADEQPHLARSFAACTSLALCGLYAKKA